MHNLNSQFSKGNFKIDNQITNFMKPQYNLFKFFIEKFRKIMSLKNLLGIFIWVVGILYRIFIFV